MGNKQSKKVDITNLKLQQWKEIGIHRQIIKIVESLSGKGQAQLQTIPFDPKRDQDKEIQIYQYRKDQDNALVKCYGVLSEKAKSHALCGSSQNLKVLTQRIPLRLCEFPQLSHAQSLYTLSESLRGYKDCYNKLGPFQVNDDMIGLNNEGEIKVWVNEDFAQNHPTFQRPVLQTTGSRKSGQKLQDLVGRKDQADMVKNIIQLIEKKNQGGRFPPQFSDRIHRNSASFDQAFRQIELYSKERNLFIPDRILNSKKNYASKQALFTPGQQYKRVQNDPLYRQPRQFSFERSNQSQVLHSGINPPPLQMQQSPVLNTFNPSQFNRVSSPIQTLYQSPGVQLQQQQGYPLNSPRTHPMGSKVTFNLMSPQNSTLVFNKQSSIYPHRI